MQEMYEICKPEKQYNHIENMKTMETTQTCRQSI